jgi:hypothetical protein
LHAYQMKKLNKINKFRDGIKKKIITWYL